jgi:hypothetical protein
MKKKIETQNTNKKKKSSKGILEVKTSRTTTLTGRAIIKEPIC